MIDAYSSAAAEHARATRDGDSTAVNQAHDEVIAAFRALRDAGRLDELAGLLDDPDPGVRLWAATHVLATGLDVQRGEAALQALTDEDDVLGFTAEITLETWRAGKLVAPGP